MATYDISENVLNLISNVENSDIFGERTATATGPTEPTQPRRVFESLVPAQDRDHDLGLLITELYSLGSRVQEWHLDYLLGGLVLGSMSPPTTWIVMAGITASPLWIAGMNKDLVLRFVERGDPRKVHVFITALVVCGLLFLGCLWQTVA